MSNVEGKPKWIEVHYVKLSNFCYTCDLFDHVYQGCDLYKDEIDENKL